MTSTAETPAYPFADLTLARRLERAEGLTNAWSVEARASLEPEVGAEWIEAAGAYAMFDGVGSPLTQTFCLGMRGPVGTADLAHIESFFEDRGSDVFHEICPLADSEVPALLVARGYRPIEFSSVLYRPVATNIRLGAVRGPIDVRRIEPGEEELWAQVSADGWSEYAELIDFILGIGRISVRRQGSHSFLAELEGRPIAAGGLSLVEGVALLAGASTIPSGRKQGAQLALLESRLRFAAESGCDIAMMAAQPGSASQRNAERRGFRIAYTRTKWMKGR